jgi:hypothetical protein
MTVPEESWVLQPSKFSVVKAVGRRMVPYLVEATLIPSVLFYVFFATLELKWAMVAVLAWTYGSVGRRIVTGVRVPGLLVLATLGITARTAIFLLSDNHFIYFVQPILRTVLTAIFFAMSVIVGRPLITRFAADFCPLTPEVQERPAIANLFRRLTFLWAGINAVAAITSMTLLLTLPVAVFVGTAMAAGWVITCSGIVLTVSDSVRTARREGLVTAVGPNGTLYAYVSTPRERHRFVD